MKCLIEDREKDEISKLKKAFSKFLPEKSTLLGYFFYENNHYFILPKVYRYVDEKMLSQHALNFYAALKRYQQETKGSTIFDNSAVSAGNSKVCGCSCLDSALKLIDFQRRNSGWLLTTISQKRNIGRVNWQRTVSKTLPLITSKKRAVYTELLTNKVTIDYDESLLILYYSILNYIRYQGLPATTNLNFEVIPILRFKQQYIEKGRGLKILKNIRYRYFDNLSLELWQLCHDFFESNTSIGKDMKIDFLVSHSFNTVYEAMVDKVLSDPELKNHPIAVSDENRRLDHIWKYANPIIPGHDCLYIGDSKYYASTEELIKDKTAINKQFVYPRNVVDNIMKNSNDFEYRKYVYDDATHAYHIIGNCLIRSSFEDDIRDTGIKELTDIDPYFKYHHKYRLFDRSTLFLIGIDVNLAKLIESYATKNTKKLETEIKSYIKATLEKRIKNKFNIKKSFNDNITQKNVGSIIQYNGTYYQAALIESSKSVHGLPFVGMLKGE